MDADGEPAADRQAAPTTPTRSGGARAVLLVLALLGTAALAWRRFGPEPASATPTRAPGAVPVTVAEVVARDVPIWLRGLGSVRAWNTVTVRPRVGGELLSVSFVEGQRVSAGDVLAQIDPRTYEIARDQAAARLAQDEARLGAARRRLQSSRELLRARAAGQLEFDLDAATVAELEATVRGDRATLAQAKLQLEYTRIVAPIAGRTGLRVVDAGNVVVADDARGVVTITQLQPIAVVFSLPQARLAELRRAAADGRKPVVEALGRDDVVLATGTLTMIDNEVDAATGTVSIKASFDNEDGALWPGQLLGARILADTRVGAAIVPEQAVLSGVAGPLVYLAQPDGTVVARPVKTGPTIEGHTIIDEGIAVGDRVVVEGQAKLADGAVYVEAGP